MQVEKDDIMQKTRNKKILTGAIHVLGWGIFFALPFFFYRGEGVSITLNRYLGYCFVPLSCLIIFYTNFLWLIERQLFRRKVSTFILSNIVLVMLLGASLHFWQDFHRKHLSEPVPKALKELQESLPKPPRYVFIARDMMLMALTVALSVAIKMTGGWYETENEKQELKKAQAEAELQNLKSQLNPHMLFNSLNTLYLLIRESPDKARHYLEELSRVMRYTLQDNESHSVTLREEMEFVQSYMYLLQVRYEDNLQFDIRIHPELMSRKLPPMALQLLVENAVKHNEISNRRPLTVSVTAEGDTVEVSNPFQPKRGGSAGMGIGLANLAKRYQLLYKKDIIVKEENHRFTVILPLI